MNTHSEPCLSSGDLCDNITVTGHSTMQCAGICGICELSILSGKVLLTHHSLAWVRTGFSQSDPSFTMGWIGPITPVWNIPPSATRNHTVTGDSDRSEEREIFAVILLAQLGKRHSGLYKIKN